MLTIGDTELETKTISVRTRDNVVHGKIGIANFIENIVKEKEGMSLISLFKANS